MSNLKYSKKSIFYSIFFGSLIALWIVFNIYNFVLEAFATNTILNIRTDYKSRVATEETVNINDILSPNDKSILNSYNCSIQPFFTKYEYFNKLSYYFPIVNTGFPYTFHGVNFDESRITLNDIYIKDSLTLTNNSLKYEATLYKIYNQNYESMGVWAVYLNDSLQYSSSLELNDTFNESIGSHAFYYNFYQSKKVFFRAVYKFKNKTTKHAEYLVIEKLLDVKVRDK